ncbi:PKD domain-containing protein [Stigmatella hybrida]|uniref:PKD domain-containing protein n=1 Tax=Stigmatella hybrida TaxID=394097 RepID=UPI001CDA9385|nr:PKD domain-containing protein [Stigmatella hybrida]
MAQRHQCFAALLSSAAVLLFASCGPSSDDEGSVQFVATVSQELTSADIASVRVTVSGAGMNSQVTNLTSSKGQWSAIVGGIPAGTNRTFLAEALDSVGTVRYTGQATGIAISVGQTAAVHMLLQQAAPSTPFTNTAPIINWLSASRYQLEPGSPLNLAAAATDPNPGNTLTFKWTANGGTFSSSTSLTTTWTAPATEDSYTLNLTVTDNHSASNTTSFVVRVTQAAALGGANIKVAFNTWPEVKGVNASPARLEAGTASRLSSTVTDNDADALTYAWTTNCQGTFSDAQIPNPIFNLTSENGTNCTLTLTVSDGRGGSGVGSLTIQTYVDTVNFRPQIDAFYQSTGQAAGGESLFFSVNAHDPDGTALTYTWTSTTGTLSGQANGADTSSITWTSPECFAQATITVTVASQGLSVAQTFQVEAVSPCTSPTFQVTALSASCTPVLEHTAITGDDRGGIAVTGSHVFINNDEGLGRFNISDFAGGTNLNPVHDSLFSNLSNGALWVLWDNVNQREAVSGPSQATHLRRLNDSGAYTGQLVPLSTPISLSSQAAFFAGWDRLIFHNGTTFYSVNLQTGKVINLGNRTIPNAYRCENNSLWGVAEYVDGEHFILYVSNSTTIRRMRLADGVTTAAFAFTNLGDMCSITVSPATGRWYWHNEYSSQWYTGSGSIEIVGQCPATIVHP